VFAGKGLAQIGVELIGDTAPLNGFFERMVKGRGVGCGVIGARDNQARMIIQNQTQLCG
jgi:hypothetical protein